MRVDIVLETFISKGLGRVDFSEELFVFFIEALLPLLNPIQDAVFFLLPAIEADGLDMS